MELTLVGLQHAGKTTFVNVIASGSFNEVIFTNVHLTILATSIGFKSESHGMTSGHSEL